MNDDLLPRYQAASSNQPDTDRLASFVFGVAWLAAAAALNWGAVTDPEAFACGDPVWVTRLLIHLMSLFPAFIGAVLLVGATGIWDEA